MQHKETRQLPHTGPHKVKENEMEYSNALASFSRFESLAPARSYISRPILQHLADPNDITQIKPKDPTDVKKILPLICFIEGFLLYTDPSGLTKDLQKAKQPGFSGVPLLLRLRSLPQICKSWRLGSEA